MNKNEHKWKLKIELFADGANYDEIHNFNENPLIKGFITTNLNEKGWH